MTKHTPSTWLIAAALAFLAPLPSHGDARADEERGFIGAGLAYEQTEDSGAFRVMRILPDGPAERAGVRPGDLIVQVNGASYERRPAPSDDPFAWVAAGDVLELTIQRGPETLELSVTATAMPEAAADLRSAQEQVRRNRIKQHGDRLLQQLAETRGTLRLERQPAGIHVLGEEWAPADREGLEALLNDTTFGAILTQDVAIGDRVKLRLSLSEAGDLSFDTER